MLKFNNGPPDIVMDLDILNNLQPNNKYNRKNDEFVKNFNCLRTTADSIHLQLKHCIFTLFILMYIIGKVWNCSFCIYMGESSKFQNPKF